MDCHNWKDFQGCQVHYNENTGEFLLGPCAAGKHKLLLFRVDGKLRFDPTARQEIELDVRGGSVMRLDIAPAATISDPRPSFRPRMSWTGMGDARVLPVGASSNHNRVFLSDGKTPAYPAELAYLIPENAHPVGVGTTDALGRISMGGAYYLQATDATGRIGTGGLMCSSLEAGPPGSAKTHVLVAWMPGICGAMVIPLRTEADARNLRVILPPPLAVSGRVSLGGKDIRGSPSLFRVVAEYEGHGSLAGLLSRSVTPALDGSFELSGLTPGKYRVQAAMDKIWLSSSVRLTVGPNAASVKPILLDIGSPGPGIVMRVVDSTGKPLPDVRATIIRPAGPLADMLWPDHFASDGAGVLRIPPLEVGTHRVQVLGAATDRLILVPPLADVNDIDVTPPTVVQ